MPIYPDYDTKNHTILLQQQTRRPFVYLDNWAFQHMIRNKTDHIKFVRLMNDKEGSLGIAFVGIYEIVRRTDKTQIDAILNQI
jgi:hypothetical protein